MKNSRQPSVAAWLVCIAAIPGIASNTDAAEKTVSFVNDVMPVLTRAGCNMGTCHAKAGGGQNGFQLSLLGFEPAEDFEHIVVESRGRRVSFVDPDQSLLLLKSSAQIAHRGGLRLPKASPGYAVLRTWISQGAPMDDATSPKFVSLDIEPTKSLMKRRTTEQLKAVARYSDGSVRDVTGTALFESNDTALAEVSEGGLVKALDLPGKASVMVRYQGRVAVFNATIPLGAPVTAVPPEKNFIDRAVFANLKQLGIPPSPVCDDSTFLRRVTLDVAGRLPTADEARAFLGSKSPLKREEWIDELLRSPEYADFFAGKWTAVLKNRRDDAGDIVSNFAFHAWVRDSLLANKPYDQFVRELLAATGTVIGNPPVAWYKRVKEPKDQIEDVAQLFLGVRVQCAQCHHHPFERWSQDDYYSLAAFFAQVGRKPSGTRGEDLIFHKRGLATATNIKTRLALKPAAFGDPTLAIAPDEDPRLRLADWMKAPGNPFFAKVLVNRYWKHFFQRGLIEPEDDIRDSNPPSNPELLAALEQEFVKSGFDLKKLVRLLTTSNAYQLSAMPNEHNLGDRQNYSRYYPRRLSAEVMLDALDHLAGTHTDFANLPPGTKAIALPDNSYNRTSEFLRVFGRPEGQSVCECERVHSSNLAQSLHMLNGSELRKKLADPKGRVEKLANDPRPPEAKIKELYLLAFAREPRPSELKTALEYFAEPSTTAAGPGALRENLQDLIWAIMNTKEFMFNH